MYQQDLTHPTPGLMCPLIFHVISGIQACEISAWRHGVHDLKIQNQDDQREQLETQHAVLRALRRRIKHKNRWKIKTQSAATRYTSENFRPTKINYRSLVGWGKISIDRTLRSSLTTICIIHIHRWHISIVDPLQRKIISRHVNKKGHGDLDTPFSACQT